MERSARDSKTAAAEKGAGEAVNPEEMTRRADGGSAREHVLRMFKLIYGNWQTCVTYAFAELAIADLLHPEPRTTTQLAEATGTEPRALRRFLRCAATIGLIATVPEEGVSGEGVAADPTYTLTPFGALLRSDHPMSQRAAARLNGAPYRYQPWGQLIEVLRTGSAEGVSPSAETGTLDYLADKPDLLEVFHRAMTDLSAGQNEPVARAYDFSPFEHVIDVGGGEGSFLEAVLAAHPHLRGTLFDLPGDHGETDDGDTHDGARGWQRRSGDFFTAVPADGDVYTMKNVIHNWPESKALALLESVRRAMESTAESPCPPSEKRLLVIEHLISEDDEFSVAKWLDLNFMVLVDGAERTLGEYRELAGKAGFELLRALPTAAGRHVIELALPQ